MTPDTADGAALPGSDDPLDALRSAGDNPIVRAFPQGAIVVFDRDLRYLTAGGLSLADVGLSPAALVGHTISEVFPPDVVAAIEPLYRQALAGQESSVDVAYKDRIFVQRLTPLLDATGRVIAGMGFTQDVTAARRSEQARRQSEAQFRSAFEEAPIGQALIGLDGRYERVNQAFRSLIGYADYGSGRRRRRPSSRSSCSRAGATAGTTTSAISSPPS